MMKLDKFDPRDCVLVLGAGFATGSTNRLGEAPPTGEELRQQLLSKVGLPNSNASLASVADYVIEQMGDSAMWDILTDNFEIEDLSGFQQTILSFDWKRIYTTNYDDSVERFNKSRQSFGVDDFRAGKIPTGAVVHLHGTIANAHNGRVNDEFVLSESAYVRQRLEESGWWDQFALDLRNAQRVFFVGYRAHDEAILLPLLQDPDQKAKRFFVLRGEQDPIAASRIARVGNLLDWGLDGFAQKLPSLIAEEIRPRHPNELRGFYFTDLDKDSKTVIQPTTDDQYDLIIKGVHSERLLSSSLGRTAYMADRDSQLAKLENAVKSERLILFTSRRGNGKTLFSEIAKIYLSRHGMKCFTIREDVSFTQASLEYLRELGEDVVVFAKEYDTLIRSRDLITSLPEATFVSEMNTSLFELRSYELPQKIHHKFARVDLDKLEITDRDQLRRVFEDTGLAGGSDFRPLLSKKSDMRDIIMHLFAQSDVATRVNETVKPLLEGDRQTLMLTAMTCCAKCAGVSLGAQALSEVLNKDPFAALGLVTQSEDEMLYSADVFNTQDGHFEPHSYFLAFHIVKQIDPQVGFEAISKLVSYVAEVRHTKRIRSDIGTDERSIISAMSRFSFLKEMWGEYGKFETLAGGFYEKLRNDSFVSREPLFWLQYAIFYSSLEDPSGSKLDTAFALLKTAYEKAASLENFSTFQIDTFAIGLYSQVLAAGEQGITSDSIEPLKRLLNLVPELAKDSDRRYLANGFQHLKNFLTKKRDDLGATDVDDVRDSLQAIIDAVEEKLAEEHNLTGQDDFLLLVKQCRALLAY
ncbi:SIR2 family protein [Corynebacterium coyleae]